MTSFANELSFARRVVARAGEIAMQYFDIGIEVDTKDDGSPVTRADKEVERYIRTELAEHFPQDGIFGEEEGEMRKRERTWIIDPIDGTFNYARGIPIWSTLLALEVEEDVVLGLVHAPAMQESFYAVRGQGAFKGNRQIRVSSVDSLERSLFNFGGPNRILDLGLWPALTHCVSVTDRQRGFGDYLGFSLVFEGRAEAMLEVGVKPWDLAPMKILVEEAGGAYFDLAGGSSIYTGSCLVTNQALMPEFKRIFYDEVNKYDQVGVGKIG
ncbi:MAG: inositol monophosphatase family protein [Candidatus Obscuribacter sp.]|nr:inositol monophosphatase family protein [Candidatus Obscuribacter sp.]